MIHRVAAPLKIAGLPVQAWCETKHGARLVEIHSEAQLAFLQTAAKLMEEFVEQQPGEDTYWWIGKLCCTEDCYSELCGRGDRPGDGGGVDVGHLGPGGAGLHLVRTGLVCLELPGQAVHLAGTPGSQTRARAATARRCWGTTNRSTSTTTRTTSTAAAGGRIRSASAGTTNSTTAT